MGSDSSGNVFDERLRGRRSEVKAKSAAKNDREEKIGGAGSQSGSLLDKSYVVAPPENAEKPSAEGKEENAVVKNRDKHHQEGITVSEAMETPTPAFVSGEGSAPPTGNRVEENLSEGITAEILPGSDVAAPAVVISADLFKAHPRLRLGGFPEPDYDIGEVYCRRILWRSNSAHSWLTRDSQILHVIILCNDLSKPYFRAEIRNAAQCLSKNSEQELAMRTIMGQLCQDSHANAPALNFDPVEQAEFKVRARNEGALMPSRVRKEGYCPVINGDTGNAVSWVTKPSGTLNVWITCRKGRQSYFAEIAGALQCSENESKETLRRKVESLCKDVPV